jgi:hypothetical protein
MFHLVANGISSDFTSAEYIGSVDLGASFGGSADTAYTAVAANNAGNITAITTTNTTTNGGSGIVVPATLTASAANVNEGSAVTFTLANQAAGTYNVTVTGTGITTGDYTTVAPVTVGADGTGTFTVNTTADVTTEGTETMLVSVAGLSQSVVINDTSFGQPTAATVAVAAAGSVTDSAATNTTYNIAVGSYTYSIAGFGSGDKLAMFAGAAVSVTPDSNDTDGIQILTAADAVSGQTVTITLTGLTGEQDAGLFNYNSINTVFGAGTIA